MSRRDELVQALASPDLEVRASAIGEVGMLALGYPPILAAMVALSADTAPLPDSHQPPSDDPFADFFGAEPTKRTFGKHATERIFRAGLPGHHLVAAALGDILFEAEDPAEHATVARLFAETLWEDPAYAAEKLIPALHARDVSLATTIAAADPATRDILVRSALNPYRSRAVNELMNAPGTRPAMAVALRACLRTLDDVRLAEALAVLVSWKACAIGDLLPLEEARPWIARFTALLDPSAEARAAAVAEQGPSTLDLRVQEARG